MQGQIPTINKWVARREFAIRAARANAVRCADEELLVPAYTLLCILPVAECIRSQLDRGACTGSTCRPVA